MECTIETARAYRFEYALATSFSDCVNQMVSCCGVRRRKHQASAVYCVGRDTAATYGQVMGFHLPL
jgi:hypothetical protein